MILNQKLTNTLVMKLFVFLTPSHGTFIKQILEIESFIVLFIEFFTLFLIVLLFMILILAGLGKGHIRVTPHTLKYSPRKFD